MFQSVLRISQRISGCSGQRNLFFCAFSGLEEARAALLPVDKSADGESSAHIDGPGSSPGDRSAPTKGPRLRSRHQPSVADRGYLELSDLHPGGLSHLDGRWQQGGLPYQPSYQGELPYQPLYQGGLPYQPPYQGGPLYQGELPYQPRYQRGPPYQRGLWQ